MEKKLWKFNNQKSKWTRWLSKAVPTKIRDELRSNFKMLSETATALKKESKNFKDESGQPQIPVFGPGKLK